VKGPSEFTQKFATPAQLTLGQESADPNQPSALAAPPRASRLRPYLPVILGVVVVLLVVAIVILILARHK
jgi:hypothetical protein